MQKTFTKEYLRRLRNHIEITRLVTDVLKMEYKIYDGRLRFICPLCENFNTAINPNTNLARCFHCQVNFNPIEIVMTIKRCVFIDAVRFLSPLLKRIDARNAEYADHRARFPVPPK